jgi:hypothetical protein
MDGHLGKRSGAVDRAVARLERFVEAAQAWVAIAAGLVLLLLQVPGIQDVAEDAGLDDSRGLIIAVGVLLLTSILLELQRLRRSVTPAITGRQHYSDPKEMYNALIEKASELKDPEQFRIDVLGLTLYSAWPELEFFLERPEVDRWTVRLATLSRKERIAARQWIPDTWPQESATTVAQVEDFRSRRGEEHHHTIEIHEYDFAPAVHGFRLGNGDVFVSVLRWRDGAVLGKHRFPYDYVPAHDVSPEADAARRLFANWFERAVLDSKAPGPGNDPPPALG